MMTETFREATQVQSFATGLIGNREAAAPDVEVKAEWITPTGAGDPPFKSGWHARAGRPASLALALLALKKYQSGMVQTCCHRPYDRLCRCAGRPGPLGEAEASEGRQDAQ